MQLREIQEETMNTESRASSVTDGEVDMISQNVCIPRTILFSWTDRILKFHSFILGDIHLLEKRKWTDFDGHHEREANDCTSDYVATVRGEIKTVRIYEGQHAVEVRFANF